MTGLKIPIFERGNVLTQEMLDALRSFSVDLGTLAYRGYADGILCGCDIRISGNELTMEKGLIVFASQVYLLSEELTIPYASTNAWQLLKIYIGETMKTVDFETCEIELGLSEQETEDRSLEVCRFRLQPGAILRTRHRSLTDYETEFDTLNAIEAKWSAYGESSVSPSILQQFLKEASKQKITNPHDVTFLYQIMNLKGQTMNRSCIEYYIAARLETENRPLSNREIFQGLVAVLKRIRSGKAEADNRPRMRKLIVD